MSKSKFYKHPQYGTIYGDTIATPIGRAAWPFLVNAKPAMEPKAGQAAGLPRYEVTLILDPSDQKVVDWLKAVKIMTKEMVALYNEGKPAKLGECAIAKDGNEFDTEKYPYYQGKIILALRNAAKPEVYNAEMQLADNSIITGGNLIKAVITPLVTAHGVSYKLMKARFIKDDGTKFAGGVNNAAVVAMLGDDETEVSVEATAKLADEEVEADVTPEVEEPVVAAPVVEEPKKVAKKGKGKIVDLL